MIDFEIESRADLARSRAGDNIVEVKSDFAKVAHAAILPAMRSYRTQEIKGEISYTEMKATVQQLCEAVENAFSFICHAQQLLPPKRPMYSHGEAPIVTPSMSISNWREHKANGFTGFPSDQPQQCQAPARSLPSNHPVPPINPIATPNHPITLVTRSTNAPLNPSTPAVNLKAPSNGRMSLVPQTTPAIVPGGRFIMPGFVLRQHMAQPSNPPAEQTSYVVFLGVNKASGVFRTYQEMLAVAPLNFRPRLVESFMNYSAAKNHYLECLHTGVIGLLKEEEGPNTIYIVTKGFEPGVYQKRRHVLQRGLQYRGGEVTYSEGTLSQAKAIFSKWQRLGHVNNLRSNRDFELEYN
ncbi:hypothetical protein BDP27DRAFT_1362219 [Rhodocollybia butyracea]|uniref:Uncharacterized protein n=1 Tax=Rhodocollybia butyracea TaxID=206335 RepID=A0A9P5PXD2_9AGAR|nr:hypothetical protein BDP27DRAFT_1362219 [Rhodocollybia butyracea]